MKLFSEKDKIPIFKEQAKETRKNQPERWEGIHRCAVSQEQERIGFTKARMNCSSKYEVVKSDGNEKFPLNLET